MIQFIQQELVCCHCINGGNDKISFYKSQVVKIDPACASVFDVNASNSRIEPDLPSMVLEGIGKRFRDFSHSAFRDMRPISQSVDERDHGYGRKFVQRCPRIQQLSRHSGRKGRVAEAQLEFPLERPGDFWQMPPGPGEKLPGREWAEHELRVRKDIVHGRPLMDELHQFLLSKANVHLATLHGDIKIIADRNRDPIGEMCFSRCVHASRREELRAVKSQL